MITVEQRHERDPMQQVFDRADLVTRLHQTLTLSRGNHYRLRLLQTLRREASDKLSETGILFSSEKDWIGA